MNRQKHSQRLQGKKTPGPDKAEGQGEDKAKVVKKPLGLEVEEKFPLFPQELLEEDGAWQISLSFINLSDELIKEIKQQGLEIPWKHHRLVLHRKATQQLLWASTTWLDPQICPIHSIGEGNRMLKALGRDWGYIPLAAYRRAALIAEGIRPWKRLKWGEELPYKRSGAWTLLDANTMLLSPRTSHPVPNGCCEFEEDKNEPPSRAYLKLWEVFTLCGFRPQAGEQTIDIGSCPGGWTWVLAKLGCKVIAVDKAPLDPKVAALPGVVEMNESAFGLRPDKIGPIDWFFADIICYPEKLLEMVERWMELGEVRNWVCTVKLQGPEAAAVLEKFRAIPGSRLIHLHANKHEVTWIKLADPK